MSSCPIILAKGFWGTVQAQREARKQSTIMVIKFLSWQDYVHKPCHLLVRLVQRHKPWWKCYRATTLLCSSIRTLPCIQPFLVSWKSWSSTSTKYGIELRRYETWLTSLYLEASIIDRTKGQAAAKGVSRGELILAQAPSKNSTTNTS